MIEFTHTIERELLVRANVTKARDLDIELLTLADGHTMDVCDLTQDEMDEIAQAALDYKPEPECQETF